MRFLAAVLFWVGLFSIVLEWRYARKHVVAITRTEKLYLLLVLPLIFGAQLALDLLGVPPDVLLPGSLLTMGVALNGWAIRRRLQRRANAPPSTI